MLKKSLAAIAVMSGVICVAQAAPSISAAETLLTYGDAGRLTQRESAARSEATHDGSAREKDLAANERANERDWVLRQLMKSDGNTSAS